MYRSSVWPVVLGLCASLPSARALATSTTPEMACERYRLANGLEVILHVDHRVPIVHTEVWYKVGSKDEAPGKTGLAHLFEHMMFEGSRHIPEDAFFRYLAQAGASARNGSTTTDVTSYYETLPAAQLELALWLESSRMGFLLDRPSLQQTFTNQREVVKNERRQRVENVPLGGLAAIELLALYPPGHPYRHEVVGSMADLDTASETDLGDFYDRYYAPGNAVLAIAGDIDPAQVKELVAKYFGPLAAGHSFPPSPSPSLPAWPAPRSEHRIEMEAKINLPRGRMAWSTVPVFTPGDAELDMIANILGAGKGSRLYQRLVLDAKIAQSVTVSHASQLLGGKLEIAYAAMPGHSLAEIEKVVDEEVAKLRTQPPRADEVTRAKNQIRTDLLQSMATLAGKATRLLYYDVFAGDPDYLRRDLERYELATTQSLMSWARKVLGQSDRVVIAVAPNPRAPIMGRTTGSRADWLDARTQGSRPGGSTGARLAQQAGEPTGQPVLTSSRAPTALVAGPPEPAPLARHTPDAPFRNQLPAPARQAPFKPPKVTRLRLRNGVSVILAEAHELPLVNIAVVVKTGSSANPKDKAGLASLTASLLDEGTRSRSAKEIADQIAQLGAALSAYATWDSSTLALRVMSENLDGALPIWADVLLNPAFRDDDVRRVSDNTLSALALRKDHPPAVASQVFARALWGDDHPFAWPDAGTPTSLPTLTPADVSHFHSAYYAPNNAVLVVSGDITAAQIRHQIEPLLAGWKAKRIPPIRLPRVAAPEKQSIVLVDKAGAPQSSVRIGLPAIERRDPDYYRALVANQILGGTFRRLAMNLRETKGWTYGISSQLDARKLAGAWLVTSELVAGHTSDGVAEIVKEIEKLGSEDVTDKELAEVKSELIGAFPARFATPELLAAQMAGLAVYDLPPGELDSFTSKIAAVDKTQVRKMARKLFRPDNLLVVVVGDRASTESPLRRIAEVSLRDLEGARSEPGR